MGTETVGDRLRKLREAAGLTLEQAGKIADTSKQSASQIEKGVTVTPGGLFLYRWARHYKVNLEWLITGKGDARQLMSQSSRPTAENIVTAARLAAAALLDPHPLDPSDPTDAELLSLALEDVIEEGIVEPTDSDALRFVQRFHRLGVSDGKSGSNRPDGGAGGDAGEAETGNPGRVAPSRSRKRVA